MKVSSFCFAAAAVVLLAVSFFRTPEALTGREVVTKDGRMERHGVAGHRCDDSWAAVGAAKLQPRQLVSVEFEAVADRDLGESVAFGFELAGQDRGKIEWKQVRSDGRTEMSFGLENGEILYAVFMGDEWEGRLLPKAGGSGWLLKGKEGEVQIEERERSAMICFTKVVGGGEVAGLPPYVGPPVVDEIPDSDLRVAEIAPLLSSLPGAPGVIYLDFDGETVAGNWSASFNGGQPIVAGSPGFSNLEIQRIWDGVAEDYRPFKVNVTTDRSLYDSMPLNRRTMVVFTPDNEWYGTAGGVAYVDIFSNSLYDDPCWVFTDQLGNSAANSHEAASHEAGHVLGLSHDGTSSLGYYEGHGSGAVGWAPIMGVGYYSVVTQWSRGEYPDANNFEDDLAIIAKAANGLGHRGDDHAATVGGATPMLESGSEQVDEAGLIERNTDIDVFSFQTGGGAINLSVVNAAVDPNLDIRLRLLDSTAQELVVADPATSLDATLATTLVAGIYYLEVGGTGAGDLATGYGDYGSLGGYSISGTVPRNLVLAASIVSPTSAAISLREGSGLLLEGAVSGGAPSWEMAAGPTGGNIGFSSPDSVSTEASFTARGLYRIRLKATAGEDQEVAELMVSVESAADSPVYSVIAPVVDLGIDRNVYLDVLTLAPSVNDDSPIENLGYQWSVLSGDGQLSSTSVMEPVLSYPAAGTTGLRLVVDDGLVRVFDEVELNARFSRVALVAAGASAKVAIPLNGSMGTAWRNSGFDDAGWQSGGLGAGYDANKGKDSRRIYLPEIGAGLDLESTMNGSALGCYLRVPFEVAQAESVLSLSFRLKYDDGFVAYLNGLEIARENVPSGAPSWDTAAPTDREDRDGLSARLFEIQLQQGMIVDGINTLAIHGMNYRIGNQDREFLLVPELDATQADLPFTQTLAAISDPSLRGAEDDADGDGRSNLYEHFAGTPVDQQDPGYRMVSVAGASSVELSLPNPRPDDVRYELQYSLKLDGGWEVVASVDGAGTWQGAAVISTVLDGSGRERVVFPGPGSDRAQGFYRLKMQLISP